MNGKEYPCCSFSLLLSLEATARGCLLLLLLGYDMRAIMFVCVLACLACLASSHREGVKVLADRKPT